MFFQDLLPEAFFEGKSADLEGKVRFWSHFRFPMGLKNDPWSDIFSQKASKNRVPRTPLGVLGPTWALHVSQNGPKAHFYRFYDDFGQILGGLLMIFRRFWFKLLNKFWHRFLCNFASAFFRTVPKTSNYKLTTP